MTVRESLLFFAGAVAALSVSTPVARGQCTGTNPITCTSSGSTITVSDHLGTTVTATNGYPSTITVPSTVSGTVSNIVVRLNGLTASITGDDGSDQGVGSLGVLLVHGSSNLEIMNSPSDDGNEGFSNVTFYISDAAVSGLSFVNTFGYMPASGDPTNSNTGCGTGDVFNPPGSGNTATSVTMDFRPSSFETGLAKGTYPSPAPASVNYSGPCYPTSGANTLNGVFAGQAAAGTWNLYVADFSIADVSITSWSVIITTALLNTTTTTLNSGLNPSFTSTPNNSVTLTADVTSGSGTVNTGTVAFTDGSTTITGCGASAVSGSGTATCVTTFTTEGIHGLSAAYSGGGSFAPSTGELNQFVKNHSTLTAGQYCNTGAISVGTSNASGTDTQPYPSVINVGTDTTGIAQSVSTVQLVLKGFSTSDTLDLSMLLVSPDRAHTLDFFDFVGGGVATPTTTVTFSDGASGQAPNGTGALASPTASYQATSYRSSTSFTPPSFLSPPSPAPQVPGTFNVAAPGGGTSAKNFIEAFNGATADGDWTLYVYDHGNVNTSSIATGWCLAITPGVGLSTTTNVSGSPNAPAPNGAAVGTTVTVTAVVKNGTSPVTTGSVTFTENGQRVAGGPAAAVNVVTSGPTQGQASFTTSLLTEGDHNILATFTDSSNTYSESFGTYVQRVDNTPTVTVNGTAVSYCNTGKVAVPNPSSANDIGAGYPNPSNINIENLFGTVKSVTVSLNGYSEGEPEFLTSLLVGPAATTGATLDFFSGAGGPNAAGPFNLIFSDAGSSLAPQNTALTAGTFKPTSYNTTDTYTPTISGFYTLPGTYNYAATSGTSTFASVFQSTNPNGNWDLYFNQTGDNPGGGIATGWCLNFTQNPPALSIVKAHSGNFVQGQQGAQFTLVVTNGGPGNSGGAIAVTVADTMPTGLTPVSGSGTGWICPAPVGQTITCSNANVVASGDSYPTLTLNVNVATNAAASLSNTATVNGSGNTVAVNSNTNMVTIVPAPVLSISKTPSGTFTQGQTAIWDITVSNTATGTSTTSGTVTVVDTLPAGYTFASNTGTGWTCGAVTVTVTCTSTTAVAGGTSFPTLAITVNVPANSPVSVTNNAVAFGGGDLTHTSLGSAVTTTSPVTVVQVPATINLTAGNNQSVTVGNSLPTNLAVTVLDAGGVAINGATVTFTAPATGASGTFAGGTNVKTATTNSSGLATATVFTTNFVAGSYSISAAAGSISTNFSVTNNPGPASIMTVNAGTTPQSATVNTAFANALAVTVTDSHNNPVSGVVIQFTAPGSGASGLFSNSSIQFQPMTNASGVATAPFTANSTAGGPYSVTAGAPGLIQVSFSLTNLAGSASSMTANAGTTPQTVTVGTAFTPLAVTVTDSLHNPISGVNVTFTAPGTGASGAFSNSTASITVATNSSGVASAPCTANTKAGSYTVTASAAGLTSVNFSLTNSHGPATIMTVNAGTTPQSTVINTAFANALAVTVTDSHNNPVSGVVIQFTAPSSGASGLFSNSAIQFEPMTNTAGVVTAPFTANGIAGGPYSVTAGAPGLTQVSFSLTNTAGAAASITVNAGTTPQSATVNTAFANALAVTVKDAFNNLISGANVVFTAPSSGASGTFSNSTNTITVATNGSGVASAPFTANGTAGGPYSVTAMVGGIGTSFSLTNTAVVVISPTVISYSVLWGSESYNVIGSPRNRLPWQITGIQVVFSEPIATGNVNSLAGTGITTTGFSGLGTNTLTWTITPIALGNFPTVLAGSGADALKDMNGNALTNGAGYNQNLKILYGDFNDDGLVNAQDTVGVNNAISNPYNILADMNGDGVVNIADVQIVRSRGGTSLP
jgi:hypothetical protein